MPTSDLQQAQLSAAPRIWVQAPASPFGEEPPFYARYLAQLTGAQLLLGLPPAPNGGSSPGAARDDLDLLIYLARDQTLLDRLISGRSYRGLMASCPCSLLMVTEGQVPLRHILLVLKADGSDQGAVEWLVRLAQPSEADVNILPLLPTIPTMYHQGYDWRLGLESLLSPESAAGKRLQAISKKLAQSHIEAHLHLRQGDTKWQMQQEIAAVDYDLIIVGEPAGPAWQRTVMPDPALILLRCTSRPLLIARSNGARS